MGCFHAAPPLVPAGPALLGPLPSEPEKPPPKAPRKPVVQPWAVACETLRRVAVTTPMSLALPIAVAHSPIFNELAVTNADLEYFVWAVTFTVTGPVLGSVLLGAGPVPEVGALEVGLAEAVKLTPWTVIVEPDMAETFPKALATLATVWVCVLGTGPDGRVVKVPPGAPREPP